MPDFVAKGKTAWQNVSTKIPDEPHLRELIAHKDPHGDPTSCALTASVLGDVISGSPLKVVQGLSAKSQSDRAQIVADLLNDTNMVYVNVTPDHHFILFPIDKEVVAILQGFQGVYNFLEWRDNRAQGSLKKSELTTALHDLVSADENKKQAAAVKLFSFSLAHEGKPASPAQTRVEAGIHGWYDHKTVVIATIASKAL